MIGMAIVPLTIQAACFMIGIDESPRWLLFKGRQDEALTTLKRLRSVDDNVDNEFKMINEENAAAGNAASWSDVFKMKKAVSIAVIVMVTGQITGISPVRTL